MRLLGHANTLGYLYCIQCRDWSPQTACDGDTAVYEDSEPHRKEDCDICHKRLLRWPPQPDCYGCLGTGTLQGFGAKPGTECACIYANPDGP